MKKRTIIILLILIFFVINIKLLFNLYYQDSKQYDNYQSIDNSRNEFEKINDESNIFDPEINLINKNSDTIKLNQLIQSGPKIIFKYAEGNCWTCVERILVRCERYKDYQCIKDNIIIVADYNNFKTFKQTFDIYNFSFDTYWDNGDYISLTQDISNKPYMMVIDKNLSIKMLFILTDENEVLLYNYFRNVYQNIYNKI